MLVHTGDITLMPNKTMDFHEAMRVRNSYLHQKDVWKEVAEHLSKFLDTDSAPAKIGISTQAEGMVVPQDVIEFVIADVNMTIQGIDNDLNQLHTSKVAEDNGDKKRPQRKKKEVKKVRAKKEVGSRKKGRRTKKEARPR